MNNKHNWNWSPEEIQRIGYQVVDIIAEYLATLPEKAVFTPFPKDSAEAFLSSTAAPQNGLDVETILEEFTAHIAPYPFGNGHPRFYGWVNSPPAVIGIFAEALAAMMNPSVAGGNHAPVYVEHQVLNWFRELLGLPPESKGLLVSGGSMANLTALAVARHVKAGLDVRAEGVQGLPAQLIVYTSEEGHSCIRKAVELLGLGSKQLRLIPTDSDFRMDIAALEAAIADDLANGHRPIAVAASAGTVNTGAIDPIEAIAAICRKYDLWLHVDGAYGAPAILAEQYHPQLAPLALADSIALDPHKWLYMPVETGLVMIKDGEAMRDAFSLVPPYLRFDNSHSEVGGLPWFSEYGIQQTRGFRALKVWMALKYFGLNGYTEMIEQDIAMAEYLANLVRQAPDLELIEPVSLSIVCFRYAPPNWPGTDEALNKLNANLLEALQLSGQAFLSGTTIRGQFLLRACVVNPNGATADFDGLVALVRQIGAGMVG